MYNNVNIRKDNIERIAKKKASLKRKIIIGIITFASIIVGSVHLMKANSDQGLIHATRKEEVYEQMDNLYGVDLMELSQEMEDSIVDFCLTKTSYDVNQSIENRMAYVAASKHLAFTSIDELEEQIQQLTGEKEVSIDPPDNSGGGIEKEVYAKGMIEHYQLTDEQVQIYRSAREVLGYRGDGSSQAWDDDIKEFSNKSAQMFKTIANNSSIKIVFENGTLKNITDSTDNYHK